MAKPSDYPGFRSLLNEWNKKLKDSGFKDIEESRHGDLRLKRTGSDNRFVLLTQTQRDAGTQYFEIIGQNIVNTTFDNEQEKQILTLYFEGHSQVEIKKKLKIQGHRCKVYRPIYKWLKAWGLK